MHLKLQNKITLNRANYKIYLASFTTYYLNLISVNKNIIKGIKQNELHQ